MSDEELQIKEKKPLITAMSVKLPTMVSVQKEAKGQVVQGTKGALLILQENNLLDEALDFEALLNDPQHLKSFFDMCAKSIDLFAETIVDKAGDPVTDEETETSCGVTLEQVKRLLISTATRRFFSRIDGKIVTKKSKKKVKHLIFFTKEVTVSKKVKLKEGAKKFDAMKRYIGFDWQLDLLEFYRDELTYAHLLVLGDDVLAIRDMEHGREVIAVHHEDYKKVREVVGPYFVNMVSHGAAAVPGILYWRKDLVMSFINAMGEDAWRFFKRDKAFFDHCTELDNARIGIYGKVLTYIHADNLIEMDRLNLDRLDATLRAFEKTFGDGVEKILAEPLLAVEILRPTVDSFIHLEAKDNEQFNIACNSSIHALKDKIADFMKKAEQHHREEEAQQEDEEE